MNLLKINLDKTEELVNGFNFVLNSVDSDFYVECIVDSYKYSTVDDLHPDDYDAEINLIVKFSRYSQMFIPLDDRAEMWFRFQAKFPKSQWESIADIIIKELDSQWFTEILKTTLLTQDCEALKSAYGKISDFISWNTMLNTKR